MIIILTKQQYIHLANSVKKDGLQRKNIRMSVNTLLTLARYQSKNG